MTSVLADGNVLIALLVDDHVHHAAALEWFDGTDLDLATCPITEGTLLRFLMREGWTAPAAAEVLETVREQPWHEFWPDDLPYRAEHLAGVIGHRQVTDAYLVALARRRGTQVATLDRGLALLHGEHAILIPTG